MNELWQNTTTAIKDFANQPLVEIIATITTVFVFILVIISKTQLGKKMLTKLATLVYNIEKRVNDKLDEIKAEKEKAEQLRNDYENKLLNALNEANNRIDELEQLVATIGVNTHNAKTLQAIEQYKGGKDNGNREEN